MTFGLFCCALGQEKNNKPKLSVESFETPLYASKTRLAPNKFVLRCELVLDQQIDSLLAIPK